MEAQAMMAKYRKMLRHASPHLERGETRLIREAFGLAEELYRKDKGVDWESRLDRSLDIATVVAGEMGMGLVSVTGALLHDVLSQEPEMRMEIGKRFGKQVADIVAGLARIASLKTTHTQHQAENFRNLLLSLSSDIRILLIRLAERLTDMRDLDRLSGEKKILVASESYYLYAPLAHRLGLYSIKSEIEDRYLAFTDEKAYRSIEQQMRETEEARSRMVRTFIAPLRKKLNEQGFEFTIRSRNKSVHSIWMKMKKQGIPFGEVYDLFAVRIILSGKPETEKADCWQAYSIVTDFYQPNPQRLRDWISVPKSNGYEALHTTVAGPGGNWVEVQIRSSRMDEIAEHGLAAHWKYKGSKAEKEMSKWLRALRESLEKPDTETGEYFDSLKINLYSDEVFVFTPKAELKRLPAGATVLDFAFDIHTEVGYHCTGARVNQKNVPIKYQLQNGDEVEILTSNTQKPKLDWLSIVTTTRARSKIRQALNEEKFRNAEAGKEMLQRRLRNWKIPFNDETVKKLLVHYRMKIAQDIYALIFQEKIDMGEIKDVLTGEEKDEKPAEVVPVTPGAEKPRTRGAENFLLIDDRMSNVDFRLAVCCNPIFGDEIFGFVTVSDGIKIHRVNCPNAAQMITRYGYRVVKARWKKTYATQSFQTVIRISGIDELGMVNKISDVISKDLKVHMRSITIEAKDGLFEGQIKLFVTSTSHLDGLLKRIKLIRGVLKAVRCDEFTDQE